MFKYLINAISKGLAFSKAEARGTLVLAILSIFFVFGTKITIHQIKSSQSIAQDTVRLEDWVAEVQASYSLKTESKRKVYSKSTDQLAPQKETQKEVKTNKKVEIKPVIKDLNKASAEDLQSIRGIGKAYSNRIIKYRQLLGGFAKTSQLSEVYGLTPELIDEITNRFSIQSEVRMIPINSDSAKLLAGHPYVSYDLAWIIINYRKQNGDINNGSELRKIKAIDDSTFNRLSPYLK